MSSKRSFGSSIEGDGGLKGRLLHGSDIPKQFDGVIVKVKAVRDSPANFNAPFIVDFFEPYPYGCKSWAMNRTNAAIAAEKIGDDPDAMIGRRMYLKCVVVENPQSGETVRSLNIGKIEGEKPPRVDTVAKAKKDAKKPPKTIEGVSEKDLPF